MTIHPKPPLPPSNLKKIIWTWKIIPPISYMILAPNEMKAEPDERKAAKICLEKIALDPEWYRIGHTKARKSHWNSCPPSIHSKRLFI